MDQTFSKQLLDPDPISQDTLLSYVSKINKAMNSALKALRWEEYLSNENEKIAVKKIIDNINQEEYSFLNLDIDDFVHHYKFFHNCRNLMLAISPSVSVNTWSVWGSKK